MVDKKKAKKVWVSIELYQRIEARAKEAGMTVDDFASKLLEDVKPMTQQAK